MPISSSPKVSKIDFVYAYGAKRIPYSVWYTSTLETVKTVIFLGTVQVGKLAEWVVADSPPGTVVIEGAPHWHAKDDGSDMHQYMYDFTEDAFVNVVKTFSLNRSEQVNVIADSQASPAIIRLFLTKRYKPYRRALVLLQPLGLNRSAYPGESTERLENFKNRIAANARHQLLPIFTDSRLRHNHRTLLKTVGIRNAKAEGQYSSGLACDSTNDLRHLYATNKDIIIICGEQDKLFPPNEIRDTLRKHDIGIDIQLVPRVPHSPLATKYGQRLLTKAFSYLAVKA